MPPQNIGSIVSVIREGKLTRYNTDNTANVKMTTGPGRPHKIPFSKLHTPPVLPQPEPAPASGGRKVIGFGAAFATVLWGLWSGFLQSVGGQIFSLLWPYGKHVMRLFG